MWGYGQAFNHERQTLSCLSAENALFLKKTLELKILPNLNSI